MNQVEDALGGKFRIAEALAMSANENSMVPILVEALNELLPTGFEIIFDATREEQGDRPDLSIYRLGAVVGYIELKKRNTLHDAFAVDANGSYQIERYRSDGLPVLLSDGARWFDVTDPARWNPQTASALLERPYAYFSEPESDAVNLAALKALLQVMLQVRPKYSRSEAPIAVISVIRRINRAGDEILERAWESARRYLRTSSSPEDLGDGRVGELIVFTLLAVAAARPALSRETFIHEAALEWSANRTWRAADLPSSLASALNDFRRADGEAGDSLLGSSGWAVIRSIGEDLRSSNGVDWDRLSALWDGYLSAVGQRDSLGSWQTPPPVAAFQSKEVSAALVELGYQGLRDPSVTAIDPCCGTGVYIQEIGRQVQREGGAIASLNGTQTQAARVLGVDISPTAVAATHIRTTSLGISPNLYMADTLRASPERGSGVGHGSSDLALFGMDDDDLEAALVRSVKRDHAVLREWSGRSAERDPVVVVLGNPPYGRGELNPRSYLDRDWYSECFDKWRKGSGGGGVLQDPYVAFFAWAFRLCSLPHEALGTSPFGVVSFITNRAWIEGKAYRPFREWLKSRASQIKISDFGPGSRGAGANRWSEQPFAIETGTAIVTVVFNGTTDSESSISYSRAYWRENEVNTDEPLEVSGNQSWSGKTEPTRLIAPALGTGGIQTSGDSQWVKTRGDREFGNIYAYRPFDNRYFPTRIPPKASRGEIIPAGFASPYSEWRAKRLFDPHMHIATRPKWYLATFEGSLKPGPAVHASTYLVDKHFFKGSEAGTFLPIHEDTPVPAQFLPEVSALGLTSEEFWLLALSLGNRSEYWTEETSFAEQLAQGRLELSLPVTRDLAMQLVEIGRELVSLWSMVDSVHAEVTGGPGAWKFEGHNEADAIRVHGRSVLKEWRAARPGDWDLALATEYARSVFSLGRVFSLGQEISLLLNTEGDNA